MTQHRPFPVLATVLTAAGVLTLCGLGHWQQDRLAWKNNLQVTMDEEFAKDAKGLLLTSDDLTKVSDSSIRRGTLQGKLDFDHQFILRGQIVDAKPASFVLIPMILPDQKTVFVVATLQAGTDKIGTPSTRAKIDKVTGTARLSRWSSFAGQNDPEKDLWYRPDVVQMATHAKLPDPVAPLFYMESSNYKLDARPTVDIPRTLRNDHKQYMFFWYTMAGILLVMYYLRFWRRPDAS